MEEWFGYAQKLSDYHTDVPLWFARFTYLFREDTKKKERKVFWRTCTLHALQIKRDPHASRTDKSQL